MDSFVISHTSQIFRLWVRAALSACSSTWVAGARVPQQAARLIKAFPKQLRLPPLSQSSAAPVFAPDVTVESGGGARLGLCRRCSETGVPLWPQWKQHQLNLCERLRAVRRVPGRVRTAPLGLSHTGVTLTTLLRLQRTSFSLLWIPLLSRANSRRTFSLYFPPVIVCFLEIYWRTQRKRTVHTMELWIKLMLLYSCCFGASADFDGR